MRSTTEVFKLCCHTCNRTVELPANRQDARLAQLEKENKELAAKVASLSHASLDMQEKCADMAKLKFHNWGLDKGFVLASYKNHYHEELGHCFIEVTYHRDADGNPVNIIELWDAIEQVNEKAHWTQKFNMWIVTLPSGEDKNCKSEKEFNELVKAYMEE
jgi:hypothetical protein